MINAAFTTCRENTKLRFVIYLCLICFLGLRVSEAVQIQINNFVLDENGYLKDVGNGFGMMILPKYKSKGKYSGSKKPYNLAVVPKLRELINSYLGMSFMKSHSPETFILRHQPIGEYDDLYDNVPNYLQDKKQYAKWVERVKLCGVAMILSIYERTKHQLETKVNGTVSSHDPRRSANDWIKKTPINLPPDRVQRIAEIHLRHRKSGSVNEVHYTSEPTISEYIHCINNALNFPWDIPSLEIWERQRMVPAPSNTYENENLYPTLNTIEAEDTIFDLVPEFKPQITISPRQKRLNNLEIEIEEIQRVLESGHPKNRITLESKLRILTNELKIIKEE